MVFVYKIAEEIFIIPPTAVIYNWSVAEWATRVWGHPYQNPYISINTIAVLENKTEDNDSSKAAGMEAVMPRYLSVVGQYTFSATYYPRYRRQEIFPANPISGLWLGWRPNRKQDRLFARSRVLCKLYSQTQLYSGFNPESIGSVLRIAIEEPVSRIGKYRIVWYNYT